jgi:hypothetical protein
MELHLKIIGWILIILALVHGIFPRYFKWKNEFKNVSLINREMMYVHTFFIALMVLLMGVLCITSATDILETKLGKTVSLGLSIFWTTRLIIQFFGYSSALWKGKIFETIVHVLFTFFWAYLSIVFFMVWRGSFPNF